MQNLRRSPVRASAARQEKRTKFLPLLRVSIGLEEADDLMADFKQAIEKC